MPKGGKGDRGGLVWQLTTMNHKAVNGNAALRIEHIVRIAYYFILFSHRLQKIVTVFNLK